MTLGVLLMAYGSAHGSDDVMRYYTHIRHGNAPSEAQLHDLLSRYDAIGGVSPLFHITEQQAVLLEELLNARHGEKSYQVYLGMKHSSPFIKEGIAAMERDQVEQAVGLVLAPHFSKMSVGTYVAEAEEAIRQLERPLKFRPITRWGTHPQLIQLLASRVHLVRERFTAEERRNLPVIFSAHSLPQRILRDKDPYPHELRQTGTMVARALGESHYTFSWQSAGRTREPWMGPDILDKLTMMAQDGFKQALICPAGFVSDHLEVLYDLDIQAQSHARKLGMHIERTPSLNTDAQFIEILADLVEAYSQ